MHDSKKLARVRWRCRRGMLELDTLLHRFVDEQYPQLSEPEQDSFEQLLQCTDQALFLWLLKREEPDDHALQHIVSLILQDRS